MQIPMINAWSDEARAAALEARKNGSGGLGRFTPHPDEGPEARMRALLTRKPKMNKGSLLAKIGGAYAGGIAGGAIGSSTGVSKKIGDVGGHLGASLGVRIAKRMGQYGKLGGFSGGAVALGATAAGHIAGRMVPIAAGQVAGWKLGKKLTQRPIENASTIKNQLKVPCLKA